MLKENFDHISQFSLSKKNAVLDQNLHRHWVSILLRDTGAIEVIILEIWAKL